MTTPDPSSRLSYFSQGELERIATAAIQAYKLEMRKSCVDKVAIKLREIDGGDEIEMCEDYEGDQAYGYRGDAIMILDVIFGEKL